MITLTKWRQFAELPQNRLLDNPAVDAGTHDPRYCLLLTPTITAAYWVTRGSADELVGVIYVWDRRGVMPPSEVLHTLAERFAWPLVAPAVDHRRQGLFIFAPFTPPPEGLN